MKKFFFLAAIICTVVFAISATCDSPVVGDHSGAPGETDCSGCHSSPVNPDIPDLHFEVGNNDTSYQPGDTYLVHVSMVRPGHNKFGFVCSALDTLNSSKGTFTLINTTTTRKYTMGGRNYVSHTPCGADSVDKISWTFNWTAPSTNKGKIKFYISMLVANHDHATTGDTTYTRVLTLSPVTETNVDQPASKATSVYPTVFSTTFTVGFSSQLAGMEKELTLINPEGKVIRKTRCIGTAFNFPSCNDLPGGMYVLNVFCGGVQEKHMLFKL